MEKILDNGTKVFKGPGKRIHHVYTSTDKFAIVDPTVYFTPAEFDDYINTNKDHVYVEGTLVGTEIPALITVKDFNPYLNGILKVIDTPLSHPDYDDDYEFYECLIVKRKNEIIEVNVSMLHYMDHSIFSIP